jgi:hypothetical protein
MGKLNYLTVLTWNFKTKFGLYIFNFYWAEGFSTLYININMLTSTLS